MKKLLFSLIAVSIMASCAKNQYSDEPIQEAIQFTSVVGNTTKATTGLIDLAVLKLSTDGFAVSTNGLGAEMNSIAVKYGGGAWKYTGDYFWPLNSTQNVSFTGYAPAGTANVALTGAGLTATNFIPASAVGSQIDLIYAAPANFNRSVSGASGVPLTFNHILSQVVFSVTTDIPGSANPTLVSLVLTVPNSKGNFDGTAWTAASNTQSFTLFNNNVLTATPVVSTPLLMIPQTIVAGTTATVTFKINNTQTTSKTVDLNDLTTVTAWQKGYKITYNIAFNYADLKIKFTDPTINTWGSASDNIVY